MSDVAIQVNDDVEELQGDGREDSEERQERSPNDKRRNKLEELFSADVVNRMAEYWTRIKENDYTEEEIDFLLFEVVQYHTVVDQKLVDQRLKSMLPFCFKHADRRGKVAPGKGNNSMYGSSLMMENGSEPGQLDIKVEVPYVEQKRMSEQARALFLQFTLEFVSFVTDVAFLFLLYDFDQTLFVVSLTVLIVAMLARLVASICIKHRVKIRWLYVVGLLVALVETNSGLRLIKLSLDRTTDQGIPVYWYGGKQVWVNKKDEISVLAETSRRLAWNEVFYICCVTLLEDIPQLVVQSVYISQSHESLSVLSQVTIGSTVLHILFQWIEAFISLRAIFRELPLIADGREMSYDEYGNLVTKFDTPFDRAIMCLCQGSRRNRRSISERVQEDIKRYGRQIRKLNLVEVRHYIDQDVFKQIEESCSNIRAFQAQGKQVTDDTFAKMARVSPNLQFVKASESAVTGKSICALRKHKRISSIVLVGTVLDDCSVRSFLDYVQPRFLPLSHTNISNSTLEAMVKSLNSQVTNIQLRSTRIDDDALCLVANHSAPHLVKKLLLGRLSVGDNGIHQVCKVFVNLVELDLHCTNITDDGLVAVGFCKHLQRLLLCNTDVGDKGVMQIADHTTKLRVVLLGGTRVTLRSVTNLLAKCPALEWMDLDTAPLTKGGLNHLHKGFTHGLTRLNLARTIISPMQLERVIRVCVRLKQLDLSNYQTMIRTTVETIASCEYLETLICPGTNFTNEWVGIITQGKVSKSLLKLDISGNVLDGLGVRAIAQSKTKYTTLRIDTARAAHDDVVYLAKSCRGLKRLGLLNVKGVNDDTVKVMTSVCSRIIEIRLGGTRITRASLRFISQRWSRLRVLCLRGLQLHGTLHDLSCEHIVDLDLGCTGIGPQDVQVLCARLKKVALLQLDHCPIRDEELDLIGRTWMLRVLTIVGCGKVSAQGFADFCYANPVLALAYFGYTRVNDQSISVMLERCPGLFTVSTLGSDVSKSKVDELKKFKISVIDELYLSESDKRNAGLGFK